MKITGGREGESAITPGKFKLGILIVVIKVNPRSLTILRFLIAKCCFLVILKYKDANLNKI